MSTLFAMSSPGHSFGSVDERVPSSHRPSSAQDEDELLALLSADTFSLESNRDRALLELSDFLKGSLPGSGVNTPGEQQPFGWPIGQAQQPIPQSTASSSASSESTSSFAYSPPTTHPTPFGTPAQQTTALPRLSDEAARPTSRAPSRSIHARSSISSGAFPNSSMQFEQAFGGALGMGDLDGGCRAPACSRERAFSRPRASSLARPIEPGTFGEEDILEDDYAMEDDGDERMDEDAWEAAHGDGHEGRIGYGH